MRKSKINKLLDLWQKNNLITEEQNKNISEFMKERQKEGLFRFIKWISIIGALYLIVGIITAIINLLKIDFLAKLLERFCEFWITYIFEPIDDFLYNIFGSNLGYFTCGIISLLLFLLFGYFANKYKSKEDIDNLNLSDEQKAVLKTNFVLDTLATFSLAAMFCFFNMLLIPENHYISNDKIIPYSNIAGAITFFTLAYAYKKNIYLLFAIYFTALSSGLFAGYGYSTYWLGVSKPIIQILIAVILLLVGYITELKANDNNSYIKEKFSSTYNWTGLFLLFTALWVTSLWGFSKNNFWVNIPSNELWCANILFITCAVGAMYIGARYEKKVYFDYGLTFFIIETYTVFCSRLWKIMPVSVASLVLGIMLITTAKILKNIYLKKNVRTKIHDKPQR